MKMNVREMMNTITTEYVHKIRDYEDSTCYAYLKFQFEHLVEIGEDPSEYEVIFLQDEEPKYTDKGMKITKRFRLSKIK